MATKPPTSVDFNNSRNQSTPCCDLGGINTTDTFLEWTSQGPKLAEQCPLKRKSGIEYGHCSGFWFNSIPKTQDTWG